MRSTRLAILAATATWLWSVAVGPAGAEDPAQRPEAIYLLGQGLDRLLEGDPGSILLAGDAARRYREEFQRAGRGAGSAVATECRITGEVEPGLARLRLRIAARSDNDRPSPLVLGLSEASLLGAAADGQAPLLTRDERGLVIWLEGKGQHAVEVELLVPLTGPDDLPSLRCTIPEVLVTTLELRVPRGATEVRLDPAAPITIKPLDGSGHQIEAVLGARPRIELRWRWVDGPPRELSPLVRAWSEVAASVEPGMLQVGTQLRLQVLKGAQQSWEFRAAAEERFLEVRATDGSVIDWQARVEGPDRVITVRFPAPVTGGTELTMTSELPWSGDSAKIRGLIVAGALSHRSWLTIRSTPELDVAATEPVNLRALDASQLPFNLRSPRPDQAFAAFAQPFRTTLSVLPRRPIVSTRTVAVVSPIDDTRATVFVRWQFTVHGGKVSQASLLLPAHFEASDVVAGDVALAVRAEEEQGRRIARVYLKGSPDQFELQLRATVPLVAARNLIKLDLPRPLDARSELSRLYLGVGKDVMVEPTPDLEPIDDPLDPSLASSLSVMPQSLRGYQTDAILERIAFRTSRIVPSVTHRNRVRIEVGPDQIAVTQVVEYLVRGGRLATVRLSVPEPIQTGWRVDPALEMPEAISAEGEARLRIPSGGPDPVTITIAYELPLGGETGKAGGDRTIDVPLVRPLDGRSDRTEVVVAADPPHRATVEGEGWRSVHRLSSTPPSEGAPAAAWTAASTADSVPLVIKTDRPAPPLAASIDRALIETTVGADGEWHTRARYAVAAIGAPVLRLRIPSDGQVTRVLWEGVPVAAAEPREPGASEVELDATRFTPPGVLEIDANGRALGVPGPWFTRTWESPCPVGDVAVGRVLWRFTLPDQMLMWRGARGYNDENRLGWLAATTPWRPRVAGGDAQAWLTGSSANPPGPAGDGQVYLFSKLVSVEPLELTCVSRPVLVLASSGLLMILAITLMVAPIRGKPWLLVVLVSVLGTLYVLEPTAILASLQCALLGLLLVLVAGAAHWWISRGQARRRSVFPEPGLLAASTGSAVRSSGGSGWSNRSSVKVVPAPIASGTPGTATAGE